MNYLGSKSQQSLSTGAPPQTPRKDSMTRECARLYTIIELFWLMQMLGNLGAKTLYFLPPSPVQQTFLRWHWRYQ